MAKQGMPRINQFNDISHNTKYSMSKTSNKAKTAQKNKNNKTKPENLMKKEYNESLEMLKKDIKVNQ